MDYIQEPVRMHCVLDSVQQLPVPNVLGVRLVPYAINNCGGREWHKQSFPDNLFYIILHNDHSSYISEVVKRSKYFTFKLQNIWQIWQTKNIYIFEDRKQLQVYLLLHFRTWLIHFPLTLCGQPFIFKNVKAALSTLCVHLFLGGRSQRGAEFIRSLQQSQVVLQRVAQVVAVAAE